MSTRTDSELIHDILDAIGEVEQFTLGMSQSEFVADLKTLRAVELELIIIGEAASKISDATQKANSQIPWQLMKALRNRLVHAYFSVDPNVLWDTVQNNLPTLALKLRPLTMP
ncbi:MAG: HepT-like ribonuclease domain-containing protein [Planctomycetota bacterium]